MSQLRLSVIIVTHNHEEYIDRCLASIIPEIELVDGEIIVVDNLSDDQSATIAKKYTSVRVFVNDERRGFSANNNAGMIHAKGQYILLLNPDTEVLPGAFRKLIEFMDTHPDVGMCGAQLVFPDGQIQMSPRQFPTFRSFVARRTPLRIFLRNSKWNTQHLMEDINHAEAMTVDWLLGACMFIRREVLSTTGPLDEGFYLYVEDIDWAKRLQNDGWKICYVPGAKIIHYHLAVSDKKFFSYYMWLHFKSMIRYARKHMLPPIWWLKIKNTRMPIWNERNSFSPTKETSSV